MFNRILSKPISSTTQIPSGAPHKQNFSSDSDATDSNKMPMQVFLKFPGGKIALLEFLEVPFLADVKQSLTRSGCVPSQFLINSRFLLQGRALSNSHPLSNGDIICMIPRLLGGVTPRGHADAENQEPKPQPFPGYSPFNFEEPFGIRYVLCCTYYFCTRAQLTL